MRASPMRSNASVEGFVASYDPSSWGALDEPIGTELFSHLEKIGAYSVASEDGASSDSIQKARAYRREELAVVAQMAGAYLLSGGYRLAEALFEGLVAVEPEESYHWLGLGLLHDRMDRIDQAVECYERAARIGPKDPRPRINLAELQVERGQVAEALQNLERARRLAASSGDRELERKATLISSRIGAKTRRQA